MDEYAAHAPDGIHFNTLKQEPEWTEEMVWHEVVWRRCGDGVVPRSGLTRAEEKEFRYLHYVPDPVLYKGTFAPTIYSPNHYPWWGAKDTRQKERQEAEARGAFEGLTD